MAIATIISSGSMAGDLQSNSVKLDGVDGFGIHARWSAGSTPSGNLKLQASNDDSNWVEVASSTAAVSGNSGSALYNKTDQFYKYVRMVYERTSGDGTLDADVNTVSFLENLGR